MFPKISAMSCSPYARMHATRSALREGLSRWLQSRLQSHLRGPTYAIPLMRSHLRDPTYAIPLTRSRLRRPTYAAAASPAPTRAGFGLVCAQRTLKRIGR